MRFATAAPPPSSASMSLCESCSDAIVLLDHELREVNAAHDARAEQRVHRRLQFVLDAVAVCDLREIFDVLGAEDGEHHIARLDFTLGDDVVGGRVRGLESN